MTHLLHLDSSARRRSFSRELGAEYASRWRAAHPSGVYTHRDLAADPVPVITEGWTELCDELLRAGITDPARYPEAVRTDAQKTAWEVCLPLLDELLAADTVLITAPMYNFTIPAALKLWIDQVTFPRMSLTGKRFVIASARGGSYQPGTPRASVEHQEAYLRAFLSGHYDVTNPVFITTELTNTQVDPTLAHLSQAHEASHREALTEVARESAFAAHRVDTPGTPSRQPEHSEAAK